MKRRLTYLRNSYRETIRIALVGALAFLLLLLHIFPKNVERVPKEIPPLDFKFTIEDIPATRQTVRKGRTPPPRPVVPVPSEYPEVPRNLTIDETVFNYDFGDSPIGQSGLTAGKGDTIPPRPVVQVLPEYPKELQKQNVRGIVRVMLWINEQGKVAKSVVVENTTNSQVCAEEALDAARRSSYIPATIGGEKVGAWVSTTYSFKPN